ncbi:hypothetical protein WA026_017410 [Henosepilachna vigintioctopunctata]|uniref:Uncharacterized protein n=1 Tax=Henosepilachna vigintioctopunctata TaxID=420089 RepID=A0AAW1V8A4_9CUCU
MDNNDIISSGLIKPINKNVVHQICSGQVILTLAIAVKELVENAIDAGANIIDITLNEYGSEAIEVSDNGSGVLEDNFQVLTLKHYTSKIQEFSDLQCLETLGFRGEALSSLCALAELSIITKHHSADEAKKIGYDKNGKIIVISSAARETGTTVIMKNLFATLPVRRKEFIKHLKREFNKMLQLLYAYCIVSKGIKFTCINITNKGNKNVIIATQGLSKVRENIISVFGAKQISSLIDVEVVMPDGNILEEYNIKSVPQELTFELEFLISSVTHGSGRSSTDRQFFYVNSRPVEPTKIIKLVNQVYKQFNANQYPFVYLNIILKSSVVDVNVTPDKRQIFLEKENIILSIIKASLLEAFKFFPSRIPVENQKISQMLLAPKINEEKKGIKRSLSDSYSTKGFLNSFRKKPKSDDICDKGMIELPVIPKIEANTNLKCLEEDITESTENKKTELLEDNLTYKSILESKSSEGFLTCFQKHVSVDTIESTTNVRVKNKHSIDSEIISQPIVNSAFEKVSHTGNKNLIINEGNVSNTELESISLENNLKFEMSNLSEETVDESANIEIILDSASKTTLNHKNLHLDISLNAIKESLEKNVENKNLKSKSAAINVKFRSIIDPENNKSAEEELQKQLSKRDFSDMVVIGQFNLGFIITRLGNDLFIVDQHATDEKYNFEQLQKSTILQKQHLVNPKLLELTAGNENILIENEEIFKHNGFNFKIDKNG